MTVHDRTHFSRSVLVLALGASLLLRDRPPASEIAPVFSIGEPDRLPAGFGLTAEGYPVAPRQAASDSRSFPP